MQRTDDHVETDAGRQPYVHHVSAGQTLTWMQSLESMKLALIAWEPAEVVRPMLVNRTWFRQLQPLLPSIPPPPPEVDGVAGRSDPRFGVDDAALKGFLRSSNPETTFLAMSFAAAWVCRGPGELQEREAVIAHALDGNRALTPKVDPETNQMQLGDMMRSALLDHDPQVNRLARARLERVLGADSAVTAMALRESQNALPIWIHGVGDEQRLVVNKSCDDWLALEGHRRDQAVDRLCRMVFDYASIVQLSAQNAARGLGEFLREHPQRGDAAVFVPVLAKVFAFGNAGLDQQALRSAEFDAVLTASDGVPPDIVAAARSVVSS